MYQALVLAVLIALSACASAPVQQSSQFLAEPAVISVSSTFHVQVDWTENPIVLGQMSNDASGSRRGGTYYAGDAGLGGFLAQIAVQAAMTNGARNKKLSKAQKNANLILEKYNDILTSVTHESLYENAISDKINAKFSFSRFLENDNAVNDKVVINLNPSYEMSLDESGLMLKLNAKVFRQLSPKEVVFEKTVKSIAPQIESDRPFDEWLKGQPSNLEITLQALYSEAVSLLLEDLLAGNNKVTQKQQQRTYSYLYGGKKRYERASLIKEVCGKRYLRNLKNNIVVIPTAEECSSI